MTLLSGKKALIFGVANDHSIAWGIAKALHEHGVELAFSYAGEVWSDESARWRNRLARILLNPAMSPRMKLLMACLKK